MSESITNKWYENAPWPEFIKSYLDFQLEYSIAPPEYHIFCAITMVAAVLGSSRRLSQGSRIILPNVYCLLLGGSGSYGKTSAIEAVPVILKESDLQHRIIGDLGSVQALPKELSRRVKRHGEASGYLIYPEFGTLISRSGTFLKGVTDDLTRAYDSGVISKTLADDEVEPLYIDNVCLTLLAASQPTSIVQYTKEGDLYTGFFPRFMLVQSEDRRPENLAWHDETDHREMALMAGDLAAMHYSLAGDEGRTPKMMKATREVKLLHNDYLQQVEQRRISVHQQIEPMYSRLGTHCQKLSIIMAVCRDPNTTTVEQVDYDLAMACTSFLERSYIEAIRYKFNWSSQSKLRDRILSAIQRAGTVGITWSDLSNNHLNANERNDAKNELADLDRRGVIRLEEGRGKRYFFVELV
jgi:hypothetical protein